MYNGDAINYTINSAFELSGGKSFKECPKTEKLRAFLSKYGEDSDAIDTLIQRRGKDYAKYMVLKAVTNIIKGSEEAYRDFIAIHPDFELIQEEIKQKDKLELNKYDNACGCMFGADGRMWNGNNPIRYEGFMPFGMPCGYGYNNFQNAAGLDKNDPNYKSYLGANTTSLMIIGGVVLLSLAIILPLTLKSSH